MTLLSPTGKCCCFLSSSYSATRRRLIASTSTLPLTSSLARPALSSSFTGNTSSTDRKYYSRGSGHKEWTSSSTKGATEQSEVDVNEAKTAETSGTGNGLRSSGYEKIQTVPFLYPNSKAAEICNGAAHSAFGFGAFAQLTINAILRRLFGLQHVFDTGVERIAFRGVLIPVWKVDLSMNGTAWLDHQMKLSVSAVDASIPGHRLSPLNQLTISPKWDTEPVAYEPGLHGGNTVTLFNPETGEPFDNEEYEEEQVPLTIIPFTHHPMRLLRKIIGLPRTTESQHGIGMDPSSFNTVLFGAYPLYLPAYLGEYAQESKRATVIAFATSQETGFSIYHTTHSEAIWTPNGDACELTIAGSPVDQTERFNPKALTELKPKLDEWFSKLKVDSAEAPFELMDPIAPGGWSEIAKDARVLEYSSHSEEAKAYVQAKQKLDSAEALYESIEALDENVKGIIVGPRGPKMANRDALVADVGKQVKEARKKVELIKPRWIRDLEAAKE